MSVSKTVINIIKAARFDNRTGLWLVLLPGLMPLIVLEKNLVGIQNIDQIIIVLLLAIIGRGCFCLLNDITDHKLDSKVPRSKSRPIASKALNFYIAIIAWCVIATSMLFIGYYTLDYKIFLMCGFAGVICFIYPFAKRITHYPQFILGLAINALIPIIWLIGSNYIISIEIFILYFAMVFFTCAYDTVYGMQDVKYDIDMGYKSMSILAMQYRYGPKIYIAQLYFMSMIFLTILLIYMNNFNSINALMLFIGFGYMILDVMILRIPGSNINIRKAMTHFKYCVLFELYIILIFII